jgi:ABC-2 type transport system permease protein
MRLNSVRVVAKREYLMRFRSKAFWIGTLVGPIAVVALTILPSLLLSRSRTSQRVAVVDETGRIGADFAAGRFGEAHGKPRDNRGEIASFQARIEPPPSSPAAAAALRASLDKQVLGSGIDSWVWIGRGVLDGKPVEYHARSVSNFITQESLARNLSAIVRRVRLERAGLDPERVGALSSPVELATTRVSEKGGRAEGGLAGAAFGYLMFFMLYMMLQLWGQQVMTGVLEEKTSRVVEVVISAVQPFELMLGKLIGVCLIGLTQLLVWLITFTVVTSPAIATSLALTQSLTLPTLTLPMLINFVLLFVVGFFIFSSFYAAIGSSFNNLQEAQQLTFLVLPLFLVPLLIMFTVINDPNSKLAVITSLIPFFTPTLMTLRVALDMPPLWQLLLAYALTTGTILLMVWFCARIYRVGILMYGKKPTVQEMWRWARYR